MTMLTAGLRRVDNGGVNGRLEFPEILFTSATGSVRVPAWVKAFPHEVRPASELRSLGKLPAMTIVQAEDAETVLAHRAFLVTLVGLHEQETAGRIVFAFRKSSREGAKTRVHSFAKLLGHFRRASDIELAHGSEGVRLAVEEAMAKALVAVKMAGPPSAPVRPCAEPLASVRRVLEATAGLRSDAGRLDAGRVADAFGLSVAELAGLLGRSRQAVSKTPDAESLQPRLRSFERITRLRAVLSGPDFRSWLNLANPGLEGRSPLEIVRTGRVDVVANLAEDLLTGAPA